MPLLCVRLLDLGDLGRPARWRALGRGARTGGELAGPFPRPARHRKRQRAHPDSNGCRGALPGRPAVGGAVARRRGMPGRAGGPVGARAGGDQRLRPHRNHRLRHDERPVDRGVGRGADRGAGARGGAVRPRRLAAPGAARSGRRTVRGRPRRRRRLCAPRRADRLTIRGLPVRRPGGADVSHRRPGAVEPRRTTALSRAAPTNRSKSAATASNSAKSKPPWPNSTASTRSP